MKALLIRSLYLTLSLLFIPVNGYSQSIERQTVRLYKNAAPGSENWKDDEITIINPLNGEDLTFNVTNPTITAYLPEPDTATGAAMVVCPGGGNTMLSMESEGHNVAKWLAKHGVAAFVLKYRLNKVPIEAIKGIHDLASMYEVISLGMGIKFEEVGKTKPAKGKMGEFGADDGRRAIEMIRKRAPEWEINPDKIGIMGFSAGAGVTLNVAFNNTPSNKPNLIVPIYGGAVPEVFPEDPAPLFIVAPEFDLWDQPTAIELYRMWHAAKLPAELHYFTGTEHGHGLKNDGEPVNVWIQLLYNFMIKTKFIEGEYILNL